MQEKETEEVMRTNRQGNLKRFFDIQDTDLVLEVRGQALPLREAEYDYIFWEPSGAEEKTVSVKNLYALLSATGKLVVYFDNPFSVHAFARGFSGEQDAQLGYPLLTALESALAESGETVYFKCYYPYPSVEFPCAFFSDKRLPGKNECDDVYYNFDRARMESFDERSGADRVTAGGMYPYLAHAYMLVLSKAPLNGYPMYVRFSNERREDAQIRTEIYEDGVVKRAVTPAAKAHVLSMKKTEPLLAESLQWLTILGKACDINHSLAADETAGSVTFTFEKGESLEQRLDAMLEEGRFEEVKDVLLSFCDSLRNRDLAEFVMTDSFRKVFGEIDGWEDYRWKSLAVTDVDLVCQNILLSDKAVVIDYEWTFDFPVPVEFLVFRFLYFYLEAKNRNCPEQDVFAGIYEEAGVSGEMKEIFLAMETSFQRYVQQGAKVLCNSFDEEGKPVLTAAEIQRQLAELEGKNITVCSAEGEEQTVTAKRSPEGIYLYRIPEASDGMKINLTGFDASEGKACVLRIGTMASCDGVHRGLSFETNGLHLGGLLYLYENELPAMSVSGLSDNAGAEISVEEIAMSEAAIRELRTTISDMRFMIDNREQQIADLKNSASWKLTKPLRALKGNKEE